MTVRLYGRDVGNGSLAVVTRGFRQVLESSELLEGFVALDRSGGSEEQEAPPGALARDAVFTGNLNMVRVMLQGARHERHWVTVTPNSTYIPKDLLAAVAALPNPCILSASAWGGTMISGALHEMGFRYVEDGQIHCTYVAGEKTVEVHVMHHGVSSDYAPALSDLENTLADYNNGKFRVVHFSTTEGQRKGTFELVQAWHLLRQRGSLPVEAELLLVLDDHAKRALQERMLDADLRLADGARMLPRGNLMPHHMSRLLCHMHVLVAPSRGEGFGLCLERGTLVTVRSGALPIELIQVGEDVLTHDGSYHRVVAVKKRSVVATLNVALVGAPDLNITREHRVLCAGIRAGERFRQFLPQKPFWVPAGKLTTDHYLIMRSPRLTARGRTLQLSGYATQPKIKGGRFSEKMCGTARSMTRAQIAAAAGVSVRQVDRVLQPSSDGKFTADTEAKVRKIVSSVDDVMRWHPKAYLVDAKLCFALGLYAADGSCSAGFVQWSLHKDRKAVAATKVEAFTVAIGLTCGRQRRGHFGLSLNCSSRWLVALFRELCPGVARTKHLPRWIWDLSRKCRTALLEGLYRGDGNWNRATAALRLTTMSPDLAMQARDLWLSLDIPASIRICRVRKLQKGTLKPQRQDGKPVYAYEKAFVVSVHGSYAITAAKALGLAAPTKVTRKRGSKFIRIKEGVFALRVAGVAEKNGWVDVYDLQVETAESFMANGIVVHNCTLEARACGVVTVSTRTTGHSAGHCDGFGTVSIWQNDTLVPIDDGPAAVAPAVTPEDIASALKRAFDEWPSLSHEAKVAAPLVAEHWSWQKQLERFVGLLR